MSDHPQRRWTDGLPVVTADDVRAHLVRKERRETWRNLFVVGAVTVTLVIVCLVALQVLSIVDRNETIEDTRRLVRGVERVLDEVERSEARSQCYFTLIAERSLVKDPAVADQMARDYLDGTRCPEVMPAPEPEPPPG